MSKSLFNEPETYLLNNWSEVSLLEKSARAIREKYGQAFQRVTEAVQKKHRQLDLVSIRVAKNDGKVGIGSSAWPLRYGPAWPTGFWIEGIALENLVSESEDQPSATVWVLPSKGITLEEGMTRLYRAAQQNLKPRELSDFQKDVGKSSASLWYYLPESRHRLFAMLRKNSAKDFIDCMVTHFERLALFLPTVEEIYQTNNRKRSRRVV